MALLRRATLLARVGGNISWSSSLQTRGGTLFHRGGPFASFTSSARSSFPESAKPEPTATEKRAIGVRPPPLPPSDRSDRTLSPPIQPFSIRAAGLFALTGTALYLYFQQEKLAVETRKKAETATAKVGKPKIGGPFVLTTQDGKDFSERELLDRWSLVYVSFFLIAPSSSFLPFFLLVKDFGQSVRMRN